MKAISPLIAVVLLIAFTIGVGGLVSIFVTGLTTTSTGITGNQSEALTRCAGAHVNVYSVTSTSVRYSNPNQVAIANLTIIAGTGEVISGTTGSLGTGASGATAWIVGTNTSVFVRALCQATIPVEGRCTSVQECWDA